MNNYLNVDEIRQLLNRSAGQLPPKTLARLSAAREQALLRHAPESTSSGWMGNRRRMAAAFATVLVTVSLFGGIAYYWQQQDDVDLAILTDEMPVDVYAN